MVQSAEHKAQVTGKTLPAGLMVPVSHCTTKKPRNGALWKSKAFPIALEALNLFLTEHQG